MAKAQTRPTARIDKIVWRVRRMSRPTRIVVNMLISLVVVGLIGLPIMFLLSGSDSVEGGGVATIPVTVLAVIWLIAYGVGWWSMVGFDTDVEWVAHRPAGWMLVFGVTAFLIFVLEIILALLFGFVL
ncbi:MAG: hypothetical protein HY862_07345 [Chloroflexi bacterium]|nr:hypothetical protein [Chloroflexota bacterium]